MQPVSGLGKNEASFTGSSRRMGFCDFLSSALTLSIIELERDAILPNVGKQRVCLGISVPLSPLLSARYPTSSKNSTTLRRHIGIVAVTDSTDQNLRVPVPPRSRSLRRVSSSYSARNCSNIASGYRMATHTSTGEREGKAHNVRQSSENDLIMYVVDVVERNRSN